MLSSEHFPSSVSITSSFLGNGSFRHSLTIVATLQYDNTTFACVLLTANGTAVHSEDALLRVQGK